jgi:hypothetical protein
MPAVGGVQRSVIASFAREVRALCVQSATPLEQAGVLLREGAGVAKGTAHAKRLAEVAACLHDAALLEEGAKRVLDMILEDEENRLKEKSE